MLRKLQRAGKLNLNFYRFCSVWTLEAPPEDVFAVLEATEDYPAWWPEIRRVDRVDSQVNRVVARSFLPYELVFETRQSRRDHDAGVLEAAMSGVLAGFSRWTVRASGAGSVAVFEEQVTAGKPLLRRLAVVARPAFRANHWLMMRRGRHGLRTYLSGYASGRRAAGGVPSG